ncbi:MAG: AbrB/MazE/SpoVT family DNA-binding domain-containing protein [Synergistaceae bacterium]|jgi:AbrB family looped-hinge helix DNA binding protein|nr:AbrB/MazE/SpoVT family DNA-binding domain-containing protein [Synergistaceae bacterium]
MNSTEIVTLSSDFQINIPPKTCAILGLQSGEKLEVIASEGRIELIPIKQIKAFRGIAKGINTNFEREKDRL